MDGGEVFKGAVHNGTVPPEDVVHCSQHRPATRGSGCVGFRSQGQLAVENPPLESMCSARMTPVPIKHSLEDLVRVEGRFGGEGALDLNPISPDRSLEMQRVQRVRRGGDRSCGIALAPPALSR